MAYIDLSCRKLRDATTAIDHVNSRCSRLVTAYALAVCGEYSSDAGTKASILTISRPKLAETGLELLEQKQNYRKRVVFPC